MDWLNSAVHTLTALVVALTGLVPVVMVIWKKVSRQERRLERFWRGRIWRGTAEGLNKGYLVEQVGPDAADDDNEFLTVAVTPAVAALYEPIAPKLVALRGKNPDLCDTELAEVIEDRFAPWIARHVCIALVVNEYACIVMALSIAKGIRPAELPEADSRTHKALKD